MAQVLSYEIACLQTRSRAVSLDDERRDRDIRENIARIGEMIDYVTAFGNSEVRLVVLPEYAINARWQRLELEDWFRLCTTIPDPIPSSWARWRSSGTSSSPPICSRCIPTFRAGSSTRPS